VPPASETSVGFVLVVFYGVPGLQPAEKANNGVQDEIR
jgi:hypothetical protein